ncbi:hypothetical protein BC332_13100 [Capsicum chinense]|nr:hypothetical protein BC332_13100 [Capsicum chinense]
MAAIPIHLKFQFLHGCNSDSSSSMAAIQIQLKFKNSNNLETNLKSDDSKKNVASVKDLPPFVLVHGIFGFGKEAFKGYENTSENWVLSITTVSGAFNGTTRTYFDGLK